MKLRNKKTGKIIESECITMFGPSYGSGACRSINEFYTLAELNEEWEDYEPKEPLIKNTEIRKIVRNWYNYNTDTMPVCYEDACTLSIDHTARIEFFGRVFAGLDIDKTYTITELCGEEE